MLLKFGTVFNTLFKLLPKFWNCCKFWLCWFKPLNCWLSWLSCWLIVPKLLSCWFMVAMLLLFGVITNDLRIGEPHSPCSEPNKATGDWNGNEIEWSMGILSFVTVCVFLILLWFVPFLIPFFIFDCVHYNLNDINFQTEIERIRKKGNKSHHMGTNETMRGGGEID